MRYLFFDTECAVVNRVCAKICAFGYCLTDEKLNILQTEEILINPESNFHLTDRTGKQGLVLPYSYDEFKKYPPFPAFYEKLRTLLEDKDVTVVGHATLNDVKFLNLETTFYKLPSFSFSFYDTQFLYMNRTNDFSKQVSLDSIAETLGVVFTAHKAVDDAYATMKIFEAMCQSEKLSPAELIQKYKIRAGSIKNYKIVPTSSPALYKYLKDKQELRYVRSRARRKLYYVASKNNRRRARSGVLHNKRVLFSKRIEEQPEAISLVWKVLNAGGIYGTNDGKCDIYVFTKGETDVEQRAKAKAAKRYELEEFYKLIGEEKCCRTDL